MELILNNEALQLVDQCVQGDAASFRLLYDHYCKAMYNTALRIVNNTADAEDVVQEAFSDAFRSLGSFRRTATFGAWLKRIVVNKSISKVKRDRKKWVDVDRGDIHEFAVYDEAEIDEEAFEYKVESVRKAMRQLPDGYRTVLSLYLVEDYKHEEIAEMLGIAHATVRTQYTRAKKKLLQIIGENNKA